MDAIAAARFVLLLHDKLQVLSGRARIKRTEDDRGHPIFTFEGLTFAVLYYGGDEGCMYGVLLLQSSAAALPDRTIPLAHNGRIDENMSYNISEFFLLHGIESRSQTA
jgi:hypothetical protein